MHWFKKVVTPRETRAPKKPRQPRSGGRRNARPRSSTSDRPVARSADVGGRVAGVAVEDAAGRDPRVDGGTRHRAAALESGHLVCPFGLWGARGPNLAHTRLCWPKNTQILYVLIGQHALVSHGNDRSCRKWRYKTIFTL